MIGYERGQKSCLRAEVGGSLSALILPVHKGQNTLFGPPINQSQAKFQNSFRYKVARASASIYTIYIIGYERGQKSCSRAEVGERPLSVHIACRKGQNTLFGPLINQSQAEFQNSYINRIAQILASIYTINIQGCGCRQKRCSNIKIVGLLYLTKRALSQTHQILFRPLEPPILGRIGKFFQIWNRESVETNSYYKYIIIEATTKRLFGEQSFGEALIQNRDTTSKTQPTSQYYNTPAF